MSKTSNKTRLYILSVVVVIVMLLFAFRLYTLQIAHGDRFRRRASQQYTAKTSTTNERGTISFSSKDGSKRTAAFQQSGYLLAVNGQAVITPQSSYQELQSVVEVSKDKFMTAANRNDDPYTVIKERLSTKTGEKIRNLGITGVDVYPQKWRQYPLNSLASHVVGFVGYTKNSTEPVGIYGTEKYYNDVLSRDAGGIYTNLFAKVFSQQADSVEPKKVRQSGNVNLTIEPEVQAYLETLLKDIKERWQAKETMGVVINPQSGAIRALGVNPDYNPNSYNTVDNPQVFINSVVRSRYEMGSIIKALTMAAGLDAGVVSPQTTYNDTGSITINGATIKNYDGVGRGANTTMQTVLNESLNTGAAFVAQKLGRKRMRSYFYDWFKGKTGVDLPGEIKNDISNLSVQRDLEFATASFGQGIALTPISTVRALASLANGGKLIRPHVTKSIEYQLGGKNTINIKPGKRVIAAETADTISRMLVNVADSGFADKSRQHHSIAVKTGTAQVPGPSGEYYENKFNHTFFGYFPAYEPRFLVFMMARRPKDVRFSSQTLAPPFFRMADFLINYYNIPPDR